MNEVILDINIFSLLTNDETFNFERSADFSADIVFAGWNSFEGAVTVAKPSSAIHPYNYPAIVQPIIAIGQLFLKSDDGLKEMARATASGGNPQLGILQYAPHESIQEYGLKKTLEVLDGISLSMIGIYRIIRVGTIAAAGAGAAGPFSGRALTVEIPPPRTSSLEELPDIFR